MEDRDTDQRQKDRQMRDKMNDSLRDREGRSEGIEAWHRSLNQMAQAWLPQHLLLDYGGSV